MRYRANKIKEKLRKQKNVFGSWINLSSLESVEMLSKSGFEFLVIDREHSAISLQTAQQMAMVMHGYGVEPVVRVEKNDSVVIKKALETGCSGIIVPMVNNRDDAACAVESMRYQPKGIRGVGLSRAQGYGLEFSRYLKWQKSNLFLAVQIEHIAAIENLDKILSVKEIDATIIGPYDLSASLGYPGEFEKKEVRAALSAYERISKKYRKPYGYHIVHPDARILKEKIRLGYKFIVYGIDEIFLFEKCKEAMAQIDKMTKKSL